MLDEVRSLVSFDMLSCINKGCMYVCMCFATFFGRLYLLQVAAMCSMNIGDIESFLKRLSKPVHYCFFFRLKDSLRNYSSPINFSESFCFKLIM